MNSFDNILNQAISLFVIIPLLAFIATLLWRNNQEKPIAGIVQFTKAFYIVAAVVYAVLWFMNGRTPVIQQIITLYKTEHFVFTIKFYYYLLTAMLCLVVALLCFFVS